MLPIGIYKIPVVWSLGVTIAVLAVTMLLSLRTPPKGAAGGAYPFSPKRREDTGG